MPAWGAIDGRTVTKVGQECESEYGLTQVFIAIRPEVLNQDPDKAQEILNETLKDIQASIPEKGNTHPTQGKSEERNPGQRGNMEKDM